MCGAAELARAALCLRDEPVDAGGMMSTTSAPPTTVAAVIKGADGTALIGPVSCQVAPESVLMKRHPPDGASVSTLASLFAAAACQ